MKNIKKESKNKNYLIGIVKIYYKIYNIIKNLRNKISYTIEYISVFLFYTIIINFLSNIVIKLHGLYIKKYPYKIIVNNENHDIISSFCLSSQIEYPKEVIDYLNNKIDVYFLDTFEYYQGNKQHKLYIPEIHTVSIKPELSEKYDFYVYMVQFNTSFIFCFKDKKQYAQFKLKYS